MGERLLELLAEEKEMHLKGGLYHTAAVGCNQTKNIRITLFVDARAIMHIYGICVPIHRELNSPASIHTKG